MLQIIHCPDVAPPAGHYAHAARAGDFVFVSGILPVGADGAHHPDSSFESQCSQVLESLARVLGTAGCSVTDIVRCTAYIVDVARWPTFNAIYAARLGDHRPARTVVPVPALHYGYLIEIDAVAFGP
jgi:2-iminobutanoate/2-iminopropanoate deaminase